MSNALQVYSAMLSVGFCIGFLLTALDWSILGLHWIGSREQVSKFKMLLLLLPISKIKLQYYQVSIVMVLLLYAACFLVTMFSARERRHRRPSLSEEMVDTQVSKLLTSVETGR